MSEVIRACVIGSGMSGLAAVDALTRTGCEVTCYEAGSAVGGMWLYENDSGLSAAYASLQTNTSRRRMQYPSFPLPDSAPEFLHHSDMLAYLEALRKCTGWNDGNVLSRILPGIEKLTEQQIDELVAVFNLITLGTWLSFVCVAVAHLGGLPVAKLVLFWAVSIFAVVSTRALARAQQHPEIVMNPVKIADAFYYLHTQDKSCWTHELQLTPFSTKPSY